MWNIEKLHENVFVKGNNSSGCYLRLIDNEPVSSVILSESNTFIWPEIEENEKILIGKFGNIINEYRRL